MISLLDYEKDDKNKEEIFFASEEQSEDAIKFLKKGLLKNYIYKTYISNKNNNTMESSKKKEEKEYDEITEKYFENNEEISEVKINLFFILSKNFRLKNNKYNDIIGKDNNIRIQRLVIQKFEKDNDTLSFKPKEYVFIPKGVQSIFQYGEDQIKFENKIMKYNEQQLLDEDNFIKKVNFAFNKETNKVISKEDFYNLKASKKGPRSKTSSQSISTKKQQSDNETKGEAFYKVNNDNSNSFMRFFYSKYNKEIDGIYDSHQEIRLNIQGEVKLDVGINNLKSGYKNDNDLKSAIVYKNFEGDIIKADEPIILEIKGGFNLIELLEQIKHTSKILNNYKGEIKSILPKTIIGIICQYYEVTCRNEMERLYDKKTDYINHIDTIIRKNNFHAVIGVIKDGKISEYSLIKPDYEIEKYYERVNLQLMNKQINLQKTENEIKDIIDAFKDKYRSLTFVKSIKMNQHYEELKGYQDIINQKDDIINQKDDIISSQERLIQSLKKKLEEYESGKNN